MLMLLSVHVTSFLFIVWFYNFALTSIGVTRSYSKLPVIDLMSEGVSITDESEKVKLDSKKLHWVTVRDAILMT